MRYVRCTAGSVWLDRTVGVPMYIWYITHNYFTDFLMIWYYCWIWYMYVYMREKVSQTKRIKRKIVIILKKMWKNEINVIIILLYVKIRLATRVCLPLITYMFLLLSKKCETIILIINFVKMKPPTFTYRY